MRQSLLFAVAALSTFAQVRSLDLRNSGDGRIRIRTVGSGTGGGNDGQGLTLRQGAVVDRREDIEKRQANIEIEGNGATVEVKTLAAENIPGLSANQNGIIAGILDALNGNKGNKANNQNCPPAPPAPPPVTIVKTIFQNASIPAPLTVFVTQAAPPPVTIVMTQSCAPPPPPPPPPACPVAPPAAPPAAAPAAPAATTPTTPPPVAAEPPLPVAAPPAASPAPPAASQPAAAPKPFIGNPAPAAGNSPTTSLNLGGLNGGANPAIPVPAGITAPAVANPAAPPNAVINGLQLSSKLVLGNLVQQNAIQARETPAARAVDAEFEDEAEA
ncbi:hypothetical protein CMUS01_12344 [Colletotrichum musicola]|uniref:Cas1p-like protein n=1 Tax=Colletotrichum musicola TaxID=2175873 RepID=A0A8H6N0M7_9PEZI|nr:hypothetical protein CMUS01_12344 [Colletotrichum musicola]